LPQIIFYKFVYLRNLYIYTGCPILISSGKYLENMEDIGKMFQIKVVGHEGGQMMKIYT